MGNRAVITFKIKIVSYCKKNNIPVPEEKEEKVEK